MVEFNFNTREAWSALNCLAGIVLHSIPGCIVEIGTAYGDSRCNPKNRQSTNVLGDHARSFNRIFYTCDIRKTPVLTEVKHKHFLGPSFDFIEQFKDTPAVVFLDGCHDDAVVRIEAKFFLEKLNMGGALFMHDMFPRTDKHLSRGNCSTAYIVRQELERDSKELNIDILTLPYTAGSHGFTVVIKHDPDRPYFRKRI